MIPEDKINLEIKTLEKFRADMFKYNIGDFKIGDIVYNTRDNDVVFIIGKVESNIMEKLGRFNPIVLVCTVKDWDTNKPELRVKYVKYEKLQKIKNLESIPDLGPIKEYCRCQCIQECSEDCILWKYLNEV